MAATATTTNTSHSIRPPGGPRDPTAPLARPVIPRTPRRTRAGGGAIGRQPVGPGRLERQEHLLRVDHPLAAEGRELEDARVHADRVLGARLDAEPAEDALAEVDVEALGVLLDVRVRVLPRDDVDAVRRAHRLAHHAGHAPGRSVGAAHQPVEAPEPRRERPPLLRPLVGHRALLAADPPAHVPEEVARGHAEPDEHLREVEALARVRWPPAGGRAGPSGAGGSQGRSPRDRLLRAAGPRPSG